MFHLGGHELDLLLTTYGYWAVLLLVALESTGIPVPGESVLLAAAVYAGTTHRLQIALVIVAAAAGAVIGDNLGYLAGREGGSRLLGRWGRYVGLDERKLRLGRYLFEKHGGKAVFFGRFVAILRVWAAGMGLLAYSFGASVAHMDGVIGAASVVTAMVLMGGLLVILRRQEARLQREADGAHYAMPVPGFKKCEPARAAQPN